METLRFRLGKYGPPHNPVGAQVSLDYCGRTLLGDVTGVYRNEVTGSVVLRVAHFDGSPWSLDPIITVVEVLNREWPER